MGNYFKDSTRAADSFGQTEATQYQNAPFLGFQYFVRLHYDGNAESFMNSIFGNSEQFNGTFPLVKRLGMPKISINTETMNQYNRNRVVQEKLKFEPIKITFHDVADGKTLKLWKAYYEYTFYDGKPKGDGSGNDAYGAVARTQSVVDGGALFKSEQFGYNLSDIKDIKNLFKGIDIFQIQATKINLIRLFNPRIVAFEQSDMAYDSNELIEVSLTFEYEWAEFIPGGNYNDDAELEWYFENFGDYYEPEKFKSMGVSVVKDAGAFGGAFGSFMGKVSGVVGSVTGAIGGAVSGVVGAVTEVVSPVMDTVTGVVNGVTEITNNIIDNVDAVLETIEPLKKEAQELLGAYNDISSMINQVQVDLFGMDKPKFSLPSVRKFSAYVNQVPTSYKDIRRFIKTVGTLKGG